MWRFIYSLLYAVLLPLFVIRLWMRSVKAPAYRQRMMERFGVQKASRDKPIWIHAVSVGEVIAISPLVTRLLNEQHKILFTTTTPTGAEQVVQRFANKVEHRFLPWDLTLFYAGFFRAHTPSALIIVETEIWPNLLSNCHRRNIPVLLANARLSEKSFAGYQRFSSLTRNALSHLSYVLAQHKNDAKRFELLGISRSRLEVSGSIKFDIKPDTSKVEQGLHWRSQFGLDRPVFIGASTHRGEDEILLESWRSLKQGGLNSVLILVPRHPERFTEVKRLAERYSDSVGIRSADDPSVDIEVWIGDSLGEMFSYYAAADVAFVGGSFSGTGGHNPLEPAALGMPIVMGPSDYNFAVIINRLIDAGALAVASSEKELPALMKKVIESDFKKMGDKGIKVVEQSRGALDRLHSAVNRIILKD